MKYMLRLDEYRKGWESNYYNVEAGNLEEAISFVLDDSPDNRKAVCERRWDTATLTIEENVGMATRKIVELYSGKVVWNNADYEKQYVKLNSADVKRLLGAEGFDDNVFEGKPLNGDDCNIYFVNKEWLEKQNVI